MPELPETNPVIVSMVTHDGTVYVATQRAVYRLVQEQGEEFYFKPVQFVVGSEGMMRDWPPC